MSFFYQHNLQKRNLSRPDVILLPTPTFLSCRQRFFQNTLSAHAEKDSPE